VRPMPGRHPSVGGSHETSVRVKEASRVDAQMDEANGANTSGYRAT